MSINNLEMKGRQQSKQIFSGKQGVAMTLIQDRWSLQKTLYGVDMELTICVETLQFSDSVLICICYSVSLCVQE